MNEQTTRLAIPVDSNQGLDSCVSPHFGHSHGFALVDVAGSQVKQISFVVNPHDEGGCLAPVELLAKEKVAVVLTRGLGRGPFAGLVKRGINVHFDSSETVSAAVQSYVDGKSSAIREDGVCGGCHGEGHHHGHHEN